MRHRMALLITSLLVGGLLAGPVGALSEFGMEGSRVVSTTADEVRASVSPDGHWIVWAARGRADATGATGLWQAQLIEGRWQQAAALPLNSAGHDTAPIFSADGRWLYFVSDRAGGLGGDDLYRAEVMPGGAYGAPQNLGSGVNTAADERSPTPGRDGRLLMFASRGHGGSGGDDLLVATWDGAAFANPRPLPGITTAADEFDGAWLGDGEAVVFARATPALLPRNPPKPSPASAGPAATAGPAPTRLYVAQCRDGRYGPAEPLALSFNTADGTTLAPVVDWNKPGELLVTGSAPSPRAGGLDIYRMRAPAATGSRDCLP